MTVIVGVDPGVSGALASFEHGTLRRVEDMPTFDGRIDAAELAALLQGADIVYLENQHPMPRNGSIASFKLGMNFGIIVCIVDQMEIPMIRVPAATWKRWNGLVGKSKEASVQLARELWPGLRNEFRLAKHHNRAEAALIARYGSWKQIQEGKMDADLGVDRHPARRTVPTNRSAGVAARPANVDQRPDQGGVDRVVPLRPTAAGGAGPQERQLF